MNSRLRLKVQRLQPKHLDYIWFLGSSTHPVSPEHVLISFSPRHHVSLGGQTTFRFHEFCFVGSRSELSLQLISSQQTCSFVEIPPWVTVEHFVLIS